MALTNGTGAVQTEYTYDPFGAVTVTGTSSTNAFQYTGREQDGTGLMYYRARYYDPLLQRFISEDPIGFEAGDSNLYQYVRSNPINRADPTGLIELGAFPKIPKLPIPPKKPPPGRPCELGPPPPPPPYWKEKFNDLAGGINDSTIDLGGPEGRISVLAPIPIDGPLGQNSTGLGFMLDIPF